MTNNKPRSGYTLPVFAAASAIAALQWLKQRRSNAPASRASAIASVPVNLINTAQTVEIPIEQVSGIGERTEEAITRSDPGDNLDLTRDTPIWAMVELSEDAEEQITLKGGEGRTGLWLDRAIDARSQSYIYDLGQQQVSVGSVLFDRQRQIIIKSKTGAKLLI